MVRRLFLLYFFEHSMVLIRRPFPIVDAQVKAAKAKGTALSGDDLLEYHNLYVCFSYSVSPKILTSRY